MLLTRPKMFRTNALCYHILTPVLYPDAQYLQAIPVEKKGTQTIFMSESTQVAGDGFEPTTFGL